MSGFLGLIGRWRRDRSGNIALMGAIVLPLVIFGGGVAIDTTNIVLQKNRLQAAVDSGALAAASGLANKHMTVDQAKQAARDFLVMGMRRNQTVQLPVGSADAADAQAKQAAADKLLIESTTVVIQEKTLSTGAKGYDVNVGSSLVVALNGMTKLLNNGAVTIAASGKSEGISETKNALSMFLVLDRSGSMAWKTDTVDSSSASCITYQESNWPKATLSRPCYVSKIATLKKAVASLFTQLKTADPTSIYVRTAAVSYNDGQDSAGTLSWGTTVTSTYVNALSAEGGTDSSEAFATAYKALVAPAEADAHRLKTGLTPAKYILFMTDGENNFYQDKTSDVQAAKSDAATKASCDKARTDGVKVFTVAFMAPTRGQNLLKSCATDSTYYFEADESDDLVAAFKAIGDKASNLGVRLTQ